jgi:hypothetical protein
MKIDLIFNFSLITKGANKINDAGKSAARTATDSIDKSK